MLCSALLSYFSRAMICYATLYAATPFHHLPGQQLPFSHVSWISLSFMTVPMTLAKPLGVRAREKERKSGFLHAANMSLSERGRDEGREQ
jgi:hypothetical protein